MIKALPRLLALILVGCAAVGTPANFLQTPSPAWEKWLNEIVDLDLNKVPLNELATRGSFPGMKIILTGVDGDSLITFQAEHVRRRDVLWTLAERYGLTMTATQTGDQTFVFITNRVLRPENAPLK